MPDEMTPTEFLKSGKAYKGSPTPSETLAKITYASIPEQRKTALPRPKPNLKLVQPKIIPRQEITQTLTTDLVGNTTIEPVVTKVIPFKRP